MLGTSVHSSFLAELSALHPRFNLLTMPVRCICKTPHGINQSQREDQRGGLSRGRSNHAMPRADEAGTAF